MPIASRPHPTLHLHIPQGIELRQAAEAKPVFERFTEKARRVIFFARYEASQYGSSVIDSEHLLLGLIRENSDLIWRFLPFVAADIRTEVDKLAPRRDRVSASVEMPLTPYAMKILNCAFDEAERLGHRQIGTEHLLVGMLMVDDSAAARILTARGVQLRAIREELARPVGYIVQPGPSSVAQQAVEAFLAVLKDGIAVDLARYFAQDAQVVDANGYLWQGIAQIQQQSEALFTPYSKRGAQCFVESYARGVSDTVIASVLWKGIKMPGQRIDALHRMTVLLGIAEPGVWSIFLLQITPVVIP